MTAKVEEIRRIADPVRQLVRIMEMLRAPDGCPWDRKQTHASLVRYMQEECAEAIDAVTDGNYAEFCDELGDVLMNIVFNSVVAKEEDKFDFDAVAQAAVDKMIRRHPHVFGETQAADADEVLSVWQQIKKQEKPDRPADASQLDGVPRSLSALARADKMQRKAAEVGFDWPDPAPVLDKLEEEVAELRDAMAEGDEEHIDEEIGDLLFTLVNLARQRKRGTAEDLARQAAAKFERRFRAVERLLREGGREWRDCSPRQLDEFWRVAKAEERGSSTPA